MANQHFGGAFGLWKNISGTDTKVGVLCSWVKGSTIYEWLASVDGYAFTVPMDPNEVELRPNDVAFTPNGTTSTAVEAEVETWFAANFTTWNRQKKYQCSGFTWT